MKAVIALVEHHFTIFKLCFDWLSIKSGNCLLITSLTALLSRLALGVLYYEGVRVM